MEEKPLTVNQERRIGTLTRQALKMARRYPYNGVSYRNLQMFDEHKEEGLELTKDDMSLTQIYAGLAVLSKEIYENESSELSEIIQHTMQQAIAWDRKMGATAFPYNDKKFPYPGELMKINDVIAKIRVQPSPDLKFLENVNIRHEWTVKVGKKIMIILVRAMEKLSVSIVGDEGKADLKRFLCGKKGIYQKLKDGGDEAELVKSLSIYLLPVIGLVSTSAAPFVVLASVILVKSYLKSYCHA